MSSLCYQNQFSLVGLFLLEVISQFKQFELDGFFSFCGLKYLCLDPFRSSCNYGGIAIPLYQERSINQKVAFSICLFFFSERGQAPFCCCCCWQFGERLLIRMRVGCERTSYRIWCVFFLSLSFLSHLRYSLGEDSEKIT